MDRDRLVRRRARALAVIVPAGAFGLVAAAAASLGGVTAPSLGADVAAVSSCDTDGVTVAFTNAYNSAGPYYQTTAVAVSGINAACNGTSIAVTLRDNANASVGSGSSTVSGGAATVTLSPAAPSHLVYGVAVIIN